MKLNGKAGVSLVEVLLVIVLLGVLSNIVYPVLINILEKSREQAAICFAESVDAAKKSFWMRNANAEQEYARQRDDDSRYLLIKEYLPSGNIPLARALPPGYKLIMNSSILDRVEIINKEGEIVY